MFNVLIAEDSKPILRNIKMLLESSELPIRIAHTAHNGEDALSYIQRQAVDILLTDIRMPKLDGLGLIEQAKAICPGLKVVLISSYSDFEYTRKAINLQVFDYLLKPVEQSQLVEVMMRVIDSLAERKKNDGEILNGLVDPAFLSEQRLGTVFQEQPAKLLFMLCRQPFTPGADEWSYERLEASLLDLLPPAECRLLPLMGSNRYLVMAQPSIAQQYRTADDWMESVLGQLRRAGVQASAAGSFQPAEPGKLSEQVERLEQLLDDELRIASTVKVDAAAYIPQAVRKDAVVHAFVDMIGQRQSKPFSPKLSELLAKWHNENARVAGLERLLAAMADAFNQADPEYGPEQRLANVAAMKELLGAESYPLFCERLLDWCVANFDRLQARNRKSGEELFRQIDSYVRLHKYAQLSINDLAAKFHVSPSYISRIIKRYTNNTFVHYYMELKIEEACSQLQANPELKIKELSDALSFCDQHYFSRVFKDHAGCSPSEYKEQLRQAVEG